ncbi:MAG TPA: type IV pilus secretin PilQ [Thermoanaerobaculia bacterium]|jgi:type IV pilus assembly protein PilQ|nr:type IV pilus secretin PilQ [Thermoanaerobaculia bacterium]
MGDVVRRRQNDRWQRLFASAALIALSAGIGCTSSKPARVVEATPAAQEAPATSKAAAVAEIRTLDLREGAPEVLVDLESSAPLVWTSFRNAEGKVVVELPNATPKEGLADLSPEDGLVSSLQVQRNEEGTRPLTRLVISTRQEVEHSISADGNHLQIRLLPVEEQRAEAGRLAFEPLGPDSPRASGTDTPSAQAPAETPAMASEPSPEPVEPMASEPVETAAAAPSVPADLGTPDHPAVAPAPAGSPATRVDGIEVLAAGEDSVIRIAGDGEFPYSTFALNQPDRFVIDLEGVMNRSARSSVPVEGGIVERVRVAQFKPAPRPVSRVVFDLRRGSVPMIERTQNALVVSFGSSAAPQRGIVVSPGAGSRSAIAGSAGSASPVQEIQDTPAPAPAQQPSDLALAQSTRPASTVSDIEVEEAPATPTTTTTMAGTGKSGVAAQPRTPSVVQVKPSTAKPAGPTEVPATGGNLGAAIQSFQTETLGDTQRTYVGEPIDLKVTNADVNDVLRTFAQISGLNMVIQPGVTGMVTAEMENVPWDQALEQILKINGLGYEVEGNVMRIAPTAILRQEAQEKQQLAAAKALSIPLQTIYRRLSYAAAEQIATLLRSGSAGLLSQRGSVIVDSRTNSLIIKELPAYMDTIVSVIDRLDTPEPQVMIEARIIETTKRFTREFGIDWGFTGIADAAHGNTTGLVFPNNGQVVGGVNVPGGGDAGTLAFRLGNVLNTFQLDVALQAAESEGLINILSAPKVATLNNQQASIESGLQIPVQTIANNTVTVQYVAATLSLSVTPQVTAEGTVMMDVDIAKREPQLAFLVPGATNAPIATKQATTRLLVRDGGTAVIGGIYKVSTDQGEDRVPGLANIPIIGNLFKNKSRREENEELLIFITPRIIKL